ncbi:MAG TPA: putative glycoside hydrolase [Candidatus Nitrosotalea sp.]|nr:putative glycoside hydrolase [Candidatus Nitrosotalea sp.]
MPHRKPTEPVTSRRRVLAAGLALLGLPTTARSRGQDAEARPGMVKGVYLSYHGVGDRTIRGRVLDLLDRTELNAVVIDVKGDEGFLPFDSQVPLAREAGATGRVRVRDFDGMLARLKAQGVYLIARIVAFKDNVLARHRPGWAITDTGTGSLWLDAERLAWLDPFEEEAWAYPIAIATEAARKGFDEIQFDYLRFPTDGPLGKARYSRSSTPPSRRQAIGAFLEQARAALRPTASLLAIDVFGYTAFNLDDTGIGQGIESLAPLVDVLSPMAYPSAYHLGIPGYRNPVTHPYEVVFETVRKMRERTAGGRAQVRPWIQNFRDYAFDRREFGVAEVQAQMKAALDAGGSGWMLWNPQNRYTVEALEPRPGPARSR